MKKIYFLLLFVCSSLLSYADGLTASLQSGDELSVYFGSNAFQDAYAEAKAGDTITLSSGMFNGLATGGVVKPITIIGTYGMNPKDSKATSIQTLTIFGKNVKVEGICFTTLTIGKAENVTIKRCYMETLAGGSSGDHTNTLIDQCCITKEDKAIYTGINYAIKNSTIERFSGTRSSDRIANITNCCIHDIWYSTPYAIYKNNIMMANNPSTSSYNENVWIYFYAGSELYNNYFILTCTYNYVSNHPVKIDFRTGCITENNILSPMRYQSDYPDFKFPNTDDYTAFGDQYDAGMDGKPVGITGGSGFNEYPAIPRIVSASIDMQNDDEGKLNASLKVKAER